MQNQSRNPSVCDSWRKIVGQPTGGGKRRRMAVICEKAPVPSESFIRRDLAELAKDYDIKVFGLKRRFPTLKNLNAILRHPTASFGQLLCRLRTINEVAEYVADNGVIVAQFAWTTADIADIAAKISRREWICCIHAWDVFSKVPASQLADRLATASNVIACSRCAADAAIAAGINPERVHIVRHALDIGKIQKAISSATKRNPLKVCAVGRLVPKKGFDILVDAWPLVLGKTPNAKLELIGDGPESGNLKALVKRRLGAKANAIIFSGRLDEDETLRRIAESAVLVLPSRRMADGDRDGISNTIVEAQALGVPVITTNAGAAGEVIPPKELLDAPVAPHILANSIIGKLRDFPQ